MTMRKHKSVYTPGPVKFLEMLLTLQGRVTLEAHGKLLGVLSEVERIIKRREKFQQQHQERIERRALFLTPADIKRVAAAADRRKRRQATRLAAYGATPCQ